MWLKISSVCPARQFVFQGFFSIEGDLGLWKDTKNLSEHGGELSQPQKNWQWSNLS